MVAIQRSYAATMSSFSISITLHSNLEFDSPCITSYDWGSDKWRFEANIDTHKVVADRQTQPNGALQAQRHSSQWKIPCVCQEMAVLGNSYFILSVYYGWGHKRPHDDCITYTWFTYNIQNNTWTAIEIVSCGDKKRWHMKWTIFSLFTEGK